jgi:hypothetical protein
LDAQLKHITEAKAADPETNEIDITANALGEMMILPLVVVIVNYIGFKAIYVILHRFVYWVVLINRLTVSLHRHMSSHT